MANTASNIHDHGEFWRPPLEMRQESVAIAQTESCARCGTELIAGSRFCHICGKARKAQFVVHRVQWARLLDVHRIEERLGLPLASLVALVAVVIFFFYDMVTWVIYTASTTLDWQAVQIWRIEWLLAAVVAFLAGILLKTAGGSKDK